VLLTVAAVARFVIREGARRERADREWTACRKSVERR